MSEASISIKSMHRSQIQALWNPCDALDFHKHILMGLSCEVLEVVICRV